MAKNSSGRGRRHEVVRIAKALAGDRALVARYRAAVAALPKNILLHKIEYDDKRVRRVVLLICEMNETAERISPGVSHRDCDRAGQLFSHWVLHGRPMVLPPDEQDEQDEQAEPASTGKPACRFCGGPLKLVGTQPRERYPNLRVETFECESCTDKSTVVVRLPQGG